MLALSLKDGSSPASHLLVCYVWALVYGLCTYLDDNGCTLLLHSCCLAALAFRLHQIGTISTSHVTYWIASCVTTIVSHVQSAIAVVEATCFGSTTCQACGPKDATYHGPVKGREQHAERMLLLLQELGSCGVGNKCYWAHGTDDLDTKAFSFDFPLINAQSGNWDRVGKKPAAVKTGRQSAWQGGAGGASSSRGAWRGSQHAR